MKLEATSFNHTRNWLLTAIVDSQNPLQKQLCQTKIGNPLDVPSQSQKCPVRPPILSSTLWFRVQVYSFLVFSQSWAALGWTGLVGSYLRLPNVDNRISLSFQADC